MLDDDLDKYYRKVQASMISQLTEHVSFSRVINEALREAKRK